MTKKIDDIDFSFDFGFTSVHEDELETVQKAKRDVQEAKKTVNDKAELLYNCILPLLDNLKKNPEKDIIYWPNRTEKIEEFKLKLKNILDQ